MIDLTPLSWARLSHAYGSAEDIPHYLEMIYKNPCCDDSESGAWQHLWSCLCHQGDIYSASIAAVPHIVAAALQFRTGELFAWDCISLPINIEKCRKGNQFLEIGPEYLEYMERINELMDQLKATPELPKIYRQVMKGAEETLRGMGLLKVDRGILKLDADDLFFNECKTGQT